MTLQWTAVALFLYAEIVVNLILCIPFISPKRWRSVFNWRIWSWLSPYWNKFFFAMIMALIILFLDAVREVQKYSGPEPMQDAKANPNVYDHVHMKLFRSQRNLYICGFSLFLWLIMRRVVTLLNQAAVVLEDRAGLQAQVEHAVKAAKQHKEDNLMLKQAVLDGEKSVSATKQQMKLEAEKLAGQLKAAEDALRKSQAEVEAMRRQAKGLAQEYDRLLSEHHQLQNLQRTEDKKDQ
ncbi:B-cell receptor-associated protein 29 [Salarias fasciatus]|uniref:B-cell receptor-associated protein 29 n=1 Tax=Salarias fasciatus TaxID=181472 RepID=UPI0011768666|nr:B-cell receptor-associated protein 29 [Salarias fasciatus]